MHHSCKSNKPGINLTNRNTGGDDDDGGGSDDDNVEYNDYNYDKILYTLKINELASACKNY